jgi:hypothetical protein
MKTYEEAVARAAKGKYQDYMDGSLIPRADAGAVGMIGFVFEINIDTVWQDVHNAYQVMVTKGSSN